MSGAQRQLLSWTLASLSVLLWWLYAGHPFLHERTNWLDGLEPLRFSALLGIEIPIVLGFAAGYLQLRARTAWPETPATPVPLVPGGVQVFHAIGPWKLAILCFATFGLYQVYWFYRNWKFEQSRRPAEIRHPFWRAFFGLYFCYWLFRLIRDRAGATERSGWGPGSLTVVFILLTICWRLPGPWWLVTYLSCLPLLEVQRLANQANAREGFIPAETSLRIHGKEWLLVGPGLGAMALAVLGAFLPES